MIIMMMTYLIIQAQIQFHFPPCFSLPCVRHWQPRPRTTRSCVRCHFGFYLCRFPNKALPKIEPLSPFVLLKPTARANTQPGGQIVM